MPKPPSEPRKYLTTAEAADILRLTTWQVVNLCRDNKLRATKPFGKWLIDPDDLDKHIAAKFNQSGDAA